MRRKIIIIQFLTLFLLGVSFSAGCHFGWKKYLEPTLIQWNASIKKEDYAKLYSQTLPIMEQLNKLEQRSWTIEFLQTKIELKWIFFAIPVTLGLLLATFLSLVILIFVRKETAPVTKHGKSSKATPKPSEPEKKVNDAIELLTCLQKDGRLIDFLQENISSYDDAQVGAAVRSIHENTKKTLAKIVSLEPVMAESEGDSVRIEAGFDPSVIRLTGSIKGNPPFTGTVCHRGWKVTNLKIEHRPLTHDLNIIEPSEVEVVA